MLAKPFPNKFSPFLTRALGLAAAVVLIAAAGFGLAGAARPAQALTNCTVTDISLDSQEIAFLKLINDYRTSSGLTTLTASVNLDRAAS